MEAVIDFRTPAVRPVAPGSERSAVGAADDSLVGRILAGDERAFGILVHTYQDRVYGLCLRMMGDRAEAEDLAQEVFLAIHQHLPEFEGRARLGTWIYQVTRNRCLNRLEFLGRRAGVSVLAPEHAPPPPDPAADRPDHQYEGREMQSVLQRALLTLPEEQRMMLLLREVEGLSYDEIAEVCELPRGTVKSRIHRARAGLSEAVARWQAGAPAPGKGAGS